MGGKFGGYFVIPAYTLVSGLARIRRQAIANQQQQQEQGSNDVMEEPALDGDHDVSDTVLLNSKL